MDYLEVVNEYFIGISMCKAKNFIRFTLDINFLDSRAGRCLVKILVLITIGSNQYFAMLSVAAEFVFSPAHTLVRVFSSRGFLNLH